MGKSKICDSYGLFNVHPIKKGEFVIPYVGELINQSEAGYRDQINSIDQSFYIFDLNSEVNINKILNYKILSFFF